MPKILHVVYEYFLNAQTMSIYKCTFLLAITI